MDLRRDGFRVSDDIALLDIDLIHAFLRDSYWAAGIPRDVVDRSLRGSLCFGVYEGERRSGSLAASPTGRPMRIWPTCSCFRRTAAAVSRSG